MVLLCRFESLNRFVDSLRRWRDILCAGYFLGAWSGETARENPNLHTSSPPKNYSTPANPVSFAGYFVDYELVCNIKVVNSMRSQKISVFRSKLRENYKGV